MNSFALTATILNKVRFSRVIHNSIYSTAREKLSLAREWCVEHSRVGVEIMHASIASQEKFAYACSGRVNREPVPFVWSMYLRFQWQ